jgi:hypothetical protein
MVCPGSQRGEGTFGIRLPSTHEIRGAIMDQAESAVCQLHPVVLPHVSHLRQVPFLKSVKLPHSPQASPS